MVQALLAGRKTQTRRVVKAKSHVEGVTNKQSVIVAKKFQQASKDGRWYGYDDFDITCYADCPYGQPGDLLWVRESFTECGDNFVAYRADNKIYQPINGALLAVNKKITYTPKWSPSIHMPRRASRLTLLVKDIRIERVQDISAEDAVAEGLKVFNEDDANLYYSGTAPTDKWPEGWPLNPIEAYKDLWNSINEQRGYGWDLNPWVWVVELEVIPHNIDQVIKTQQSLDQVKNLDLVP